MNEQDRAEFDELRKKVDKIDENVKEFNEKMNQLTFHLIGDSTTGTEGIIQEFRKVKMRLTRVEKFYLVVAGIVGFVISYFTKKYLEQ